MLVLIVDTEAEFDWLSSSSRAAAGVTSVKKLIEIQPLFDKYGIRPTLVLDYPVSSTPDSYKRLHELILAGKCEIGAHLQPWDTPPLVEPRTNANSYPGNLPRELERAKLLHLTETIIQNLGVKPRIYKAGRYGIGQHTAGILGELGFDIDLSVLPNTDLRRQEGPDFSKCDARPYWFGAGRPLLEIPLSTDYMGPLSSVRSLAHTLTGNPFLKAIHVPGILSRLRLLDRSTLTPEGVTFEEQRKLTLAMMRRGHKVFSLTYHSSSLTPGYTPYVRTPADLELLLDRIDRFLHFFLKELGGRAATPFDVRDEALSVSEGGV